MSIEGAIFARLSGFAGLTALVVSRIYPELAPQSPTSPFLTYSRISTAPRESAMGTDAGLVLPRFQVSSWADGEGAFETARAVAEQVRAALQRFRGTLASTEILDSFLDHERHIYDGELQLHQVAMDFLIWHRE